MMQMAEIHSHGRAMTDLFNIVITMAADVYCGDVKSQGNSNHDTDSVLQEYSSPSTREV